MSIQNTKSKTDPVELWIIFAFSVGIMTGWLVSDISHKASKEYKKNINYSQMEKTLDKAQCDAEKVEILWAERIRLTGKPNP